MSSQKGSHPLCAMLLLPSLSCHVLIESHCRPKTTGNFYL